MMPSYGNLSGERCRLCGLDLPHDTVSVMAHYNSHWRQCNLENVSNLNACAFEPQLDIRIDQAPINPEDLEVSGHLEQHNFHYSYSPQTEPSNLSVTGTRCSPLNLTGRPKSESPITSPLTSPLPNDSHGNNSHSSSNMNLNTQSNHLQNVGIHSDMNASHHYPNFNNNGMFSNCHLSNQMISSISVNETIDMSCHAGSNDLNVYDLAKKRRRPEREMKCLPCNRCFYTKASYDEHMRIHHFKSILDSNQNSFIINSEPIDLNHSVQEVPDVMPTCTVDTSKPYKCSICDQEFLYREELTEHANNHEASKPYRCDLCGTGLSHISALRRHILSHSGHKPHVCEICSRGFFQKCDLMRHYSTHGKKKDTQCSSCKKKYFSEYFLKNHKCKPPENPKPFKCEICGNSCSTNVAWSYHMWKHTKNPIFIPFQSKLGTNKTFGSSATQQNCLS